MSILTNNLNSRIIKFFDEDFQMGKVFFKAGTIRVSTEKKLFGHCRTGRVQSSYIIIVLDLFEFKELGPKEYVSGEFKK